MRTSLTVCFHITLGYTHTYMGALKSFIRHAYQIATKKYTVTGAGQHF